MNILKSKEVKIALWAIIALSFYALNSDAFSISFGTSVPRPVSDERIKEIIKQIHERNSMPLTSIKKDDMIEEPNNDEKIEQ